jgi:rod shape-determining protein MreD
MSLQVGMPLLILAALLQATVLPYLRISGGQPDLVVVITLAWALLDDGVEAAVWALVGGVALDLFSGAPMGFSALILLPGVFLISLTETQVYHTNALFALGIAGSAAVLYHVLHIVGLYVLMARPVVLMPTLYYITMPAVVFDLVLILPTFWLLRPVYARLHPGGVRLQL